MDEKLNISAKVVWDRNLKNAFIKWLNQGKCGSVEEDRGWYDEQIARAEKNNPDRSELANYLMAEAGFGASDSVFRGFEEHEN